MTINFVIPQMIIGGDGTEVPTIQMYRRGFIINGNSAPTWQDVILSGNTALTLVNAKANSMNYLKLFGGTEFVPETYIDSVTAEGKCVQRNLPEGYTQVEYVGGKRDAYADLGAITIETTDTIYCECILVDNGKQVFGLADHTRCYVAQTGNGTSSFAGVSYAVPLETWVVDGTTVNTIKLTRSKFTINGVNYTPTGTASDDVCSNFGINAIINGTSGAATSVSYMNKFYIKSSSGNYKVNLIPFRDANNNFGYYDTVSNTFLTNIGTGTFTAGANVTTPTPSRPIDIVCNNGVLKVSRNLFDKDTINTVLGSILGDGSFSPATNRARSEYIPVVASQTYTLSIDNSNIQVVPYYYNSSKAFLSYDSGWKTQPFTFTVPNNCSYLCVLYKDDSTEALQLSSIKDIQVEQGSTATPYAPYPAGIYTDGTTETITDNVGNVATCTDLLAVGSYKDTQEILSGAVSRNIGIKVLDGTENWQYSSVSQLFYADVSGLNALESTHTCYCTHFKGIATNTSASNQNEIKVGTNVTQTPNWTRVAIYPVVGTYSDVTAFTSWLATQYANGTPVIIIYPTNSATTESVTGQLLTKAPVTYAGSISGLTGTTVTSSHTTPTPTNPLQINCNNGVVKVSPNLYDGTYVNGYYIDSNGTVAQGTMGINAYSSAIKVIEGNTYTLSGITGNIPATNRIHGYNGTSTNNWVQQIDVFSTTAETSYSDTFTIPNGVSYIRFSQTLPLNSNVQLELGSTATTYRPYGQIYVNGTQEKVEVFGKNLFDKNAVTIGHFYNANLEYTASETASLSDYIPVIAGESYTLSGIKSGTGNFNIRTNFFNKSKEIQSQDVYGATGTWEHTITIPNGINYVRYSFGTVNIDSQQFELGSTATTYEPYYYGGSALAEMLLKVGTYQDVQEVLAGDVTRKVGIKVLDGTENWGWIATTHVWRGAAYLSGLGGKNDSTVISTHFSSSRMSLASDNLYIRYLADNNITSLEDWKQFLSDQYNAGQPVIILYPLATATTETVTAQPLTIQEGTNLVEITEASMDNLPLEVSYKAGVTVTITEVENAQLDNSVEVTING